MNQNMPQSFKRFRQRRVDEATRKRWREHSLSRDMFIWPVFLVNGPLVKKELSSMPGVYHYSVDRFLIDAEPLVENGLKAVLLFGVPEQKGIEQASRSDGIVQQAVPRIKQAFPGLQVITDVCLCSFTGDGHCHIGDNDATCKILARIALSHAAAGTDVVAPSDMMDGRVWHISHALQEHGYTRTRIMSYAAKYASNYYGPFRFAAHCAPKHSDRKTYQMDPGNSREALDEIAADLEEGAQAVIIKPALAYLDIIARARQQFTCPIAAYNVSGEYTMILSAIGSGAAAEDIIYETLLSIRRAGADRIISYFTPWILERL